jgi:hypothetical protein
MVALRSEERTLQERQAAAPLLQVESEDGQVAVAELAEVGAVRVEAAKGR